MKNKIQIAIIVVVSLLVISNIVSIFKGSKSKGVDYRELMAQKDSTISAIRNERLAWELLADEKDRRIYDHERNDSILAATFQQNQTIHKQLNAKLSQISGNIQRISDNNDSLRLLADSY